MVFLNKCLESVQKGGKLHNSGNFEMTKIFYKMDKQFVAVLDEAVGIRCFKRLSRNFMTTFVRGTNFILKFFIS